MEGRLRINGNNMKIVIFTADSNGGYPVPAVKGGAVSTLIESLVAENNKKKLADFTVVSFFNEEAKRKALNCYPNVNFVWIKVPDLIQLFDKALFWGVRKFFKKKKAISFKSVFSLLYYIKQSSKYLKSHPFDKVVLENNVLLARIIVNSNYDGEYYYHFHNVPRIDGGCKEAFEKCNGYLCVSKYVGNQISLPQNPIGPIPKNKIRVLYNCINTELFKPLPDRRTLKELMANKYGFDCKNNLIVFTGRLSKEKGVDIVLDAVESLHRQDITVLVVGSLLHGEKIIDSFQEFLKDKVKRMGEHVIFTGYVEQKDMPLIYNAADLAVLPSMWDEPAGLTMIEAMACGTPVITTESGGIPEYVGEKAYILTRDENIVTSLANSINSLLDNKVDATYEFSCYVKDKFSVSHYLESFIDCLQKNEGYTCTFI